jgi:hypothetical protein
MESRRFRGEPTAMGFFVLPMGDNWFKSARCFRSFLCRETKGDIFVGTHFGSGFFRSTDDSNTWCREKQWVDSDGRSGNCD